MDGVDDTVDEPCEGERADTKEYAEQDEVIEHHPRAEEFHVGEENYRREQDDPEVCDERDKFREASFTAEADPKLYTAGQEHIRIEPRVDMERDDRHGTDLLLAYGF